MVDLKEIQRQVFENKVNKGFNTTDVHLELCYLQEEVSEVFQAYRKKLPDLGEELADVGIFLLGIAEILGVNFEEELLKKVEKNKNRQYILKDGVYVKISG